MSKDVMVDLETLGTSAGCVVLSIGACTLDSSDFFLCHIDIQDSINHGLFSDPSTVAWWNKQDPLIKERAFSGDIKVVEALGRFTDWFARLGPTRSTFIWGNGADFDLPILAAAYKACNMKAPWEPYNGRCYRTLKNLYKDVKPPTTNPNKHDALADAKFQAQHAYAILKTHFARVQD